MGKPGKGPGFGWGRDRIKSSLWDMLSLRCLEDISSSHIKQGIGYAVWVLRGERLVIKTTKAMGVDEIV